MRQIMIMLPNIKQQKIRLLNNSFNKILSILKPIVKALPSALKLSIINPGIRKHRAVKITKYIGCIDRISDIRKILIKKSEHSIE
jgi:hypothetical protein